LNREPIPQGDYCSDCGTELEPHAGHERCPVCFDGYLHDLDAGFLESYRKFGCRSRLVVAETCLRGLVLDTPDHRKVLAMTIFEQYVQSMNDLAGLFLAFRSRHETSIMKSFLEFRLDRKHALSFFDAVQSVNDIELLQALDLPLPREVAGISPHLDESEAYSVAVAIYQLVQDLRKATEQGEAGAMALSQFASSIGGAVIASDASWLEGAAAGLTPDQVAMLVLDSKQRSLYVQGLTADENSMGKVVDAIDTATRAASNLIYAYLELSNK
jgi:hypothetical protein